MRIFLPVLDSLESVATADDLHTFFFEEGVGAWGVCHSTIGWRGRWGGGLITHLACSVSPSSCSDSHQCVSSQQHNGGCVQQQYDEARVLQS